MNRYQELSDCRSEEELSDKTQEHEALRPELRDAIQSQVAASLKTWDAFEQDDNPVIEHDCAASDESPIVTSLLTFITVTTFLAGFAVADFGSFSRKDWDDEEGQTGVAAYAFLLIMASVSGNAMYLSVMGVLIAAAYYRARNQQVEWESCCLAAVKPISEALATRDGLKGQRRLAYLQAHRELLRANADWANSAAIFQQKHQTVNLTRGIDPGTWKLRLIPPSEILALKGFGILTSYTFPVTVVLYLVAQAMRALRGMDSWVVAAATGVVSWWAGCLILGLRPIYWKLND